MNNDSFSFSMPIGSGTPADSSGARYLAPPFDARMADEGHALLLMHGEQVVRRLPLQLVQVLGQCSRFRSLDEHVGEVARALRVAPQQAGTVRQALDELVRQGLLLTEGDVIGRLGRRDVDPARITQAPIDCLFVRTCGRPDTLDRLLTGLAEHALPDGLAHLIVLDDDSEADGRRSTRAVVDGHRAHFGERLKLIDTDQRHSILERMAHDSGVDPDRLRWCIEGDADDPEASYGASLNFALLLGAGRRFTIMDDDAAPRAFALRDTDERPAFRRRQSACLEFPEPDQALPGDAYAALDRHPVALHADYLGTDPAALAERAGDDTRTLLEDLDPQALSELSAAGRVRLTSSGTLGDPGTESIQWLFTEEPGHFQPLCESEARYRALLEQRRMARSAARPEITPAFGLMTTTMTGIDNRDLLLPTQPRGANEDLFFGALVSYLYPGSLQANLPHMLLHMRPEPRRWQASDLDRPRGLTRGAFLAERVRVLAPHVAGGADERANGLAATLRGLAGSGRDELARQLAQELLEVRSQTIERVSAVRQQLQPPPWLDRDFARVIEQHGNIDERQQRLISELADDLPRFLSRYADSIDDWVSAWRHCREVNLDDFLGTEQ